MKGFMIRMHIHCGFQLEGGANSQLQLLRIGEEIGNNLEIREPPPPKSEEAGHDLHGIN